MEASGGAATATSDTGTGGETPDAGGEETTAPATPDFGEVAERLERQMAERFDRLEESRAPAAEPQGEPDDPYADLYEGLEAGEPVDIGELTKKIEAQVERKFEERLQQTVEPVLDRLRDQDLATLEQRYPALQDPKTAEPVVQEVRQFAEMMGDPEMAQNPHVVEMVYLAQMGRSRAEQETPAGAQTDGTLEAGGAAPQEPSMSQFERIAAQNQDPSRQFWNW